MEYKLNINTWYADRLLDWCPMHFVSVKSKLTNESLSWIQENLRGRYAILYDILDDFKYPAFEDSKEAILFELMWSN